MFAQEGALSPSLSLSVCVSLSLSLSLPRPCSSGEWLKMGVDVERRGGRDPRDGSRPRDMYGAIGAREVTQMARR